MRHKNYKLRKILWITRTESPFFSIKWGETLYLSRKFLLIHRRWGRGPPGVLLGNRAVCAGHNTFMRREFENATDGELWALAASNREGRAFGELFERHVDSVYNFCFRRTGSWSAAEDLTSLVFLEAWRRRKEVQLSGDSILPWLFAVSINCCRNLERTSRRHRRLLAKLSGSKQSESFENAANQRIDDERLMSSVLATFNRLRPEERDVITLCDWFNLTYSEAAIALDIPLGTVRSRLSRARANLRNLADVNDGNRAGVGNAARINNLEGDK